MADVFKDIQLSPCATYVQKDHRKNWSLWKKLHVCPQICVNAQDVEYSLGLTIQLEGLFYLFSVLILDFA